MLALFLQALYGAVDLLIVSKFASSADVSAVSTGSQIMTTLTNLVSSFAMGTTILLGQQIGSGKKEEGGGGMLVIVAYNLIGCIFRGLGDSRRPLITVAIACVFNVAGDLLLCAVFGMGTAGAAIATVFAQIISVIVFFILISKKDLPFTVKKKNIRIHKTYLRKMTAFGAPIALQEILGAFCVRVPISYIMSIQPNTSLFHIGLATPMSSILQLILCVGFMLWLQKNRLLDDKH